MNITKTTTINDILARPEFAGFGERLFPLDLNLPRDTTMAELTTRIPWYVYIRTERTIAILEQLSRDARAGRSVFYEIYTDKEKKRDPRKARTGLFFFRGEEGAPTAIVNAGGGFQYVGAMHDSFPHAQILSQAGYNAFALIYRPGAQTAREDLARSIAFLHEHETELGIDMKGYSLWGGSAGGRMAAWLGNTGPGPYGEKAYPKPSAVITQYTGLSEVTGQEPATYAVVGSNDWIASYRTMENRIAGIRKNGTPAEIEVFSGLPHGFGLGEGTKAEGWIQRAIDFWKKQLKTK